MLGELSSIITEKTKELYKLKDERETFVLANEDNMPEWLYNKKLAELDKRIAELQDDVWSFNDEYDEVERGGF